MNVTIMFTELCELDYSSIAKVFALQKNYKIYINHTRIADFVEKEQDFLGSRNSISLQGERFSCNKRFSYIAKINAENIKSVQ